MSEQKTAPGWYPHPSLPGSLGYWDGDKWTEHVAPGQPPPQRASGGMSVWMIVGGILIAALVIWFVYAVVTANDDLSDVTNGQASSGGIGDASSSVVNLSHGATSSSAT